MRNQKIRRRIFPAAMLSLCMLAGSISGCGAAGAGGEAMSLAETQTVQPVAEGEEPLQPDTAAKDDSGSVLGKDSGLDEATKKELVTQLLQEQNMDVSVVGSADETKKCTFTLPEGFAEAEDIPGMYVAKHYPVDLSTIYCAELDRDIALQLMTEEAFISHLQSALQQIYGTEVNLTAESFETLKIDGFPAFRILCSYTVDAVQITQLGYIINADKSYVITYSQTDEYDRMEEFEASAMTIRVE